MEPVVVNDVGLTWRWCTTTGQYWRTFTWALCFDYCETKTTTFSVHSRPTTIGQCHGRLMLPASRPVNDVTIYIVTVTAVW